MANENQTKCADCGVSLPTDTKSSLCVYCEKSKERREEHRASWVPYMDVEAMKGLEPGMYLGLFHGFKNEQERQDTDDWGEKGPCIGPLIYAHTTYAAHIKLRFKDDETAHRFGYNEADDFNEIKIKGDVVEYDGMEYGDWTCFVHPTPEMR